MSGDTNVVTGVDGLTAEWLSGVLGCEVRHVSAQPIGTGQMGSSYRLTIDGDDDAPPTLVAKLAAGDPSARSTVQRGYRCEVGFYTDLQPTLDVRSPRCWYGAISDDHNEFTLLLDDLAPAVPGVQADGCSVPAARRAVANLGGLHGPSWNRSALHDADYLLGPDRGVGDFMQALYVQALEQFAARFDGMLSDGDLATMREVGESVGDWYVERTEPFALLHGDYRLDNLMFAPDGDVIAIDWQTMAIGPPMRDVAYFLGNSLAVDDRRAHEEDILGEYRVTLEQHGVTSYDAEQCWVDYRIGHLQGPVITVLGAVYAAAERTDRADQMFLAMARRSCEAIRDLRSLELL
jgi:hypothetical protein